MKSLKTKVYIHYGTWTSLGEPLVVEGRNVVVASLFNNGLDVEAWDDLNPVAIEDIGGRDRWYESRRSDTWNQDDFDDFESDWALSWDCEYYAVKQWSSPKDGFKKINVYYPIYENDDGETIEEPHIMICSDESLTIEDLEKLIETAPERHRLVTFL